MYRKLLAESDVSRMNGLMSRMTPQQRKQVIGQAERMPLAAPPEIRRQPASEFIRRIGITFDIDHGSGLTTRAVMPTYHGLHSIGIKVETPTFHNVFYGISYFQVREEDGLLVNSHLYLQWNTLGDIVKKYPEFADNIGFYRLAASETVAQQLNAGNIDWFWTGEKCTREKEAPKDTVPPIITYSQLGDLRDTHFYVRYTNGKAAVKDPNFEGDPHYGHGEYYLGAFILGVRIS